MTGSNGSTKGNFFKNLHTDEYKWYDFFLISLITTFLLVIVGQLIGYYLTYIPFNAISNENNRDFMSVFSKNLSMIGIWFVTLLYIRFTKRNRPMLKALTPFCKGNTIKMLLLGLLVGFLQNSFCIMMALLHKDIYIRFDSFNVIQIILLFISVFIQSSAEELVCRGFLYQSLRRGYKNPMIAVVGNAVLFTLFHVANDGVTALALINICVVALFYSLVVYYCDSIWFTMAAHCAWNFTQNIIFGLPNSGNVSPVSIFKLDASTAKDSFAYNVGFGVEATIVAALLIGICCVAVYLWGSKNNRKPTEIWN